MSPSCLSSVRDTGDQGRLTSEDTEDFVRDLVERFETFVRRWEREPAY